MINRERLLLDLSPAQWIKKIIFCFFGVAFIGFAIAFNNLAGLGNDPLSVFFDGARVVLFNLTGIDNLGLATNIINYTLLIVIFFIARQHIHIGTFIYVLPLGNFVSLGIWIFKSLKIPTDILACQIASSVVGCILLFLGLAIFISLEIGLDPWTALIMFIAEKTNQQFRTIKIGMDVTTLLIGWAMGGKFFVTTVVAAIVGGPTIQMFTDLLNKTLFKALKINKGATKNT